MVRSRMLPADRISRMSCLVHDPHTQARSLQDRTAEVKAVVRDLIVMIGGLRRDASLHEFFRNVRRLEAVAGVVTADRPAELIRPALDDEVEPGARRLLLDVLPGCGDLNLLEGVEIEIRWRSSGCRHVGNHDAVHGPDGVVAAASLRSEIRLLTGLVAGDVHPVHLHAGHRPQQRPRIARRRDLAEFVLREIRSGPGRLGVDDRRAALDGDRLLYAADAHRERQLDVGADNDHRLTQQRYEAGQLGGHFVRTGRDVEKSIAPVTAGDERRRAVGPGECHRHAWQHAALLILDESGDRAALHLRSCRRHDRVECEGDEEHRQQAESNCSCHASHWFSAPSMKGPGRSGRRHLLSSRHATA